MSFMSNSEKSFSGKKRYAVTLFDSTMSADEKLKALNRAEKRFSSWFIADREFAPLLEDLRNAPPPATAEAGLIYTSAGKYVWKLECPASRGKTVIAYKTNPGKTPWRYILKSSLTVREVRNYLRFEKLGIPVAPVIAVGDDRKNFILKETFIITGFVTDTADGLQFMEGGKFHSDTENKLIFCKLNLELLARLHHASIFHKAFHPRNLLWRNTGREMEIFWIDVARCRIVSRRQMFYAVIQDLHTFFSDMRLTRTQTAELLEYYCTLAPKQYLPGTAQELLDKLIHFRRRLFSKKKYKLFAEN